MKKILTGILGIAAALCLMMGATFISAPVTAKAEESAISEILVEEYLKEVMNESNTEVLLNADSADKLASGRDTGNGATIGVAADETYGSVWTLSGTNAANTDFHATNALNVTNYKTVSFKIYNPTSTDIVLVLYGPDGKWTNSKRITAKAQSWTDIEVDTSIYGGNFFFIIDSANWINGTWKITSFVGVKSSTKLFSPDNDTFTKSCSYGGAVTVTAEADETYGKVFAVQVSQNGEQGLHLSRTVDVTGYEKVVFGVYNPCSVDRRITIHGGWSAWARVSETLAAGQWTNITVPASVFTEDKSGYIYIMLSGSDTASDVWKITSFVGINNASVVEHFIDKLPETSEITEDTVYKYAAQFKNIIGEIESSFTALTETEKATISAEKQAKIPAVKEALSVYGILLNADGAASLSSGRDTGNGAAIGVATDETYGSVWTLSGTKAANTDFHAASVIDVTGYEKVTFMIYNPTSTDIVLVLYGPDGKWANSKRITAKAQSWTDIEVDTSIYGGNFFFIIDSADWINGTWKITSFIGKYKTQAVVTITDEGGNTLATGADALTYDGTTLNGNDNYFVGFLYNGVYYKTVAEIVGAATEEAVTVVAKTLYVKTGTGASVRVTGTPGLRFDAYADTEATAYGVILSAPELFGSNEFTIEALTENGVNFKNAYSGAEGFKSEVRDSVNFYSIVLQNVKEANFKKYFAARAYVTVTYADGSSVNVYSDYSHADNSRSISEVAKIAYDNNGYENEAQKKVLENFIATTLVSANDSANLASGRDTGVASSVGITSDEIYGSVWTLNVTGDTTDFHATYLTDTDVESYEKIIFRVYNPQNHDVALVLYGPSNAWENSKIITAKAGEWTDIEVDTSIYKGTFFFVIATNANGITGEWKITSFKGIEKSANQAEENNAFTEAALNGALSVDAKKKFKLTAYDGPTSGIIHDNRADNNDRWVKYRKSATLSDIKKYMDAGFEYWCADNAWYGRAYLKQFAGMNYEHDAYWALDMAAEYYAEYGEKCPVIVTIDGLANSMKGTFAIENVATDEENYKAFLTSAVRNLKSYIPSNGGKNFFAGVQLCDEPNISLTESYKKIYNFLVEDLGLTPDKYVLNGALFGVAAASDYIGNDYETYFKSFASFIPESGLLLYDTYPFKCKETWLFGDKAIMVDGYFRNLQIISAYAKEKGLIAGTCIQSMKFNGDRKSYYRIDNREQISMQVYCALAFGYEYLNYFVYTEPYNLNDAETYEDACVTWNTETNTLVYNDLYTWANGVNNEVKGFENVLLSFDYQGTQIVKTPAGDALDKSYSAITASATYATLIGHFKQNELNGYLVANAYDPCANSKSNTVTLTTNTASAVVYIDGVPQIVNASGGKITLTLEAGAGAFVIPVP